MKKTREIYDVVYESDISEFLRSVQKHLDEGWHCQGGVSTYYDMQQHHVVFSQAFIDKSTKYYSVDDED